MTKRIARPRRVKAVRICDDNFQPTWELPRPPRRTARLAPEVREAIENILEQEYGRASSPVVTQSIFKVLAPLWAEAQRDKERLDWLATQCYLPGDHPDDGVLVVVSETFAPLGSFTLSPEHDAAALRVAIDAARQGGAK